MLVAHRARRPALGINRAISVNHDRMASAIMSVNETVNVHVAVILVLTCKRTADQANAKFDDIQKSKESKREKARDQRAQTDDTLDLILDTPSERSVELIKRLG